MAMALSDGLVAVVLQRNLCIFDLPDRGQPNLKCIIHSGSLLNSHQS